MLDVNRRVAKLEAETASLRAEIVILRARLNAKRVATPLPAVIVPSSTLWPLRVLNRRDHVML
jgi:hypothetical protein